MRNMQIASRPAGSWVPGEGFQPWLIELVFLFWVVISVLILCLVLIPRTRPVASPKSTLQAATESMNRLPGGQREFL